MTGPTPPAPIGPDAVYVHRSLDGGATWTLLKVIPDAEGFAMQATPDYWQMLDAPEVDNAVIAGMAGFNGTTAVQLFEWMSDDAGLSWTHNPNWAEPYIDALNTPGGVIGFPGSRPIIGGRVFTPQASIVG